MLPTFFFGLVATMTYVLVDLEFRRKVKSLLTRKELYFCFVFLVFALVSWTDVIEYATGVLHR